MRILNYNQDFVFANEYPDFSYVGRIYENLLVININDLLIKNKYSYQNVNALVTRENMSRHIGCKRIK
jgi:hypothetical protein